MNVAEFNYHLPPELIAQHPAPRREDSRLMVVRRRERTIEHRAFYELPQLVGPEHLLVLNNTRVFPARLYARREGHAAPIEILLLRPHGSDVWEVLLKPARRVRPGARLVLDAAVEAEVLEGSEQTTRRVRFCYAGDFWKWIERHGRMPTPPYIQRRQGEEAPEDRERYQTVIARVRGSIAAPTAGLHFTTSLLRQLHYTEITLHVGYGTFKPIRVDRVEDHRMEPEYYEVTEGAAQRIRRHVESGGKVVAVGTTTTRVLEHLHRPHGGLVAGCGWTDLFIYPGFQFGVVTGLITNFHLPKSTLLLLVSAFASKELLFDAYQEAIRARYRFYSYGDAMLIL